MHLRVKHLRLLFMRRCAESLYCSANKKQCGLPDDFGINPLVPSVLYIGRLAQILISI